MTKSGLKRIFIFTICVLPLLFVSCGGSKNTVDQEKLQRTEDDLQRREQDLQQKTVEMLDLKNQIIILQSEISQLKTVIIDMEGQTDSLQTILKDEKEEAQNLKGKLSEVEENRTELERTNEALRNQISNAQDSIRISLETAAVRESEQNLIRAFAETQETDTSATAENEKTLEDTAAINQAIDPVMNLTDDEYQQHYQEALDLLFAKQRNKAISEFQELIRLAPSHDYADNCQYWIGEGYYAQGIYDRAVTEFKKVLEYSSSNKLDHAQFKIGLSYLKSGRKKEGLEAFKVLIEKYPDSELVSKVKDILASGQI